MGPARQGNLSSQSVAQFARTPCRSPFENSPFCGNPTGLPICLGSSPTVINGPWSSRLTTRSHDTTPTIPARNNVARDERRGRLRAGFAEHAIGFETGKLIELRLAYRVEFLTVRSILAESSFDCRWSVWHRAAADGGLFFVSIKRERVVRRDLDDVIQGWPYDPEPGEHLAREVRARDGRKVLQVRIELGVLQLEVGGRPDGVRPHGFVTYLDYLRHTAASRGPATGGKSPPWVDVGPPVRRGRPRIHPVLPPPRRLAGPGPTRQGHPGRRPYARLDGLRPAARQRGRLHRLARTVPRDRLVPPHPGRHCAGTRAPSARRGHRCPARRDRTIDNTISAPGGKSTTRANRPTPL